MKVLPENTEKGKDKGIRSSTTWSYPSGHYTLDLLKVCILALTLVTIATILIMKVLIDFLVETKIFSKVPTIIFHQLNDMINVPQLQHVHQLVEIEKLNNDEQIRKIILSGQTGAGKTEAAYWVCRQAKSKYSVIAKISASNKDSFEKSLKRFATNLNLNLGLQHEEGEMEIIESISSTIVTFLKESGLKNNFLVLIDDVHVDNAVYNSSETTLTSMVLKTIFLLSSVNTLKFIITTTNPMLIDDFRDDCKEVKFEGMTTTECISFLQGSKHLKEETHEAIESLRKKIGCLPITIDSARKFMFKQNMHIKKFIEIYEKLNDKDDENITEVVKCQKIPLNYIKNNIENTSWEVITLLPCVDYNSINLELIEAICHHVCKDETKAELIISKFRDYSLCHYLERPRLRICSTEDSQKDIILSFHSETMLTLKVIEKKRVNKNTSNRHKLFVLLKVFCFEIDLDVRIDTTLERNLMFLNHAQCVLRFFEKGDYDLNENEKVYLSYINYLIGKTILYQGTDIRLAHKHLMKSRKLCLELVEEDSDLTSRKCPFLASKKETCTEEMPIMDLEKVSKGYKSLSSKKLDHEFVNEFVLSKRRNKRDVYVLQNESQCTNMCSTNYLSVNEYINLTACKPKLAMPLESICKSFLSELMLHILHDNGRALNELMLEAEHNIQVKTACAFEVSTYKKLNSLIKNEEEFKDFPLLRYLAIERGEQDINIHQCTLDDMKFYIDNLNKLLQNEADHYFQFGVVKTMPNQLEHHRCSCYRLLIKCMMEKYELSPKSERKEILIEGSKYVKLLQTILLKIDSDENAVIWVEIPKFYNQCAHFLQLSGTIGEHKEIKDALDMYDKAIKIEENRQEHITRFLLEGYYGKVNCLINLNMERKAKDIYKNLQIILPSNNVYLKKIQDLFQKKDILT